MMKFSTQAKTIFYMLVCSAIVGIQGCTTPAKQPKFNYASCSDVAEFSKKSLPSPSAMKGAKCGFLTVPENRSKPNQNSIDLAVMIVPSVSEHSASDPVVYLAGGPGGSAFIELDALVNDGVNRDR